MKNKIKLLIGLLAIGLCMGMTQQTGEDIWVTDGPCGASEVGFEWPEIKQFQFGKASSEEDLKAVLLYIINNFETNRDRMYVNVLTYPK